jgi:hypothetical protein
MHPGDLPESYDDSNEFDEAMEEYLMGPVKPEGYFEAHFSSDELKAYFRDDLMGVMGP